MTRQSEQPRSRSTELTGGEGYTYEDTVVAYYLASLLRRDRAIGIDGDVSRVAVQQKAQGEPMDDLIVDTLVNGETRRLSLQVKRSLTISDSNSNIDFREIVDTAKATRAKSNFRTGFDRYGFVTCEVGSDRFKSLARIIKWARSSDSGSHFAARFKHEGESNNTDILVRQQICSLLFPTNVDYELDFFSHFVALRLDGLEPNAAFYTEFCNRLSDLAANPSCGGEALAAILCRLVREGEGTAKVWTRPSLLADLRPLARLKAAPAFQADLLKLKEEATFSCKAIEADIGGIELCRSRLFSDVESVSQNFKLTNIRGQPGVGKSVILRRVIDAAINQGPVLFLKSDRLERTSWVSHANAIGLQTSDPRELLAQVGATGTPTLFIDGIDRILPKCRGIVTDLIRVIESDPALGHWRIIATSRDQGLEAYRQWVPASFYQSTGIGDVHVKELNDDEAWKLVKVNPNLKPLLFGADSVKAIARRPFFASVLAKGTVKDDQNPPTTEIALIDTWWKAGGYEAEPSQALLRQRALLDCAKNGTSTLGRSINIGHMNENTQKVLPDLIHDGLFRSVEDGVIISFAHDIYFEWAFYKLLIEAGDEWIGKIKKTGEAPLLGRIVGLFSQRAFGREENWAATFHKLGQSSLRSQWQRAWMLGPTASTTFYENISQFETLLFGDDFKLLNRFLTWFQAESTIPNPIILKAPTITLDGADLVRAADYHGWPSDIAAWTRVLSWLLDRTNQLPVFVLPSVASLFSVWQNMLSDCKTPLSERLLQCAQTWLEDLEHEISPNHAARKRWEELGRDAYGPFVSTLRRLILRAGRAYPNFAESIVEKHSSDQYGKEKKFQEIVEFSPLLAETCPKALADMTRRELLEELPQDKINREQHETTAYYTDLKTIREKPESELTDREKNVLSYPPYLGFMTNYDFEDIGINRFHPAFSSSPPLNQPFAALLESAPKEGLKLVRDLSNHATEGWKQIHFINAPQFGTPLPLKIDWPWGEQIFCGDNDTYSWYLGSLPPQPLVSSYLALTYWAHQSIDANRSVDDVIRDVVCGHENWTVLGLAISLALETMHVSETVFSLLKSQRLWSADCERYVQAPLYEFTMPDLDPRGRMSSAEQDALSYLQERKFNTRSLRDLAPHFVFCAEQALSRRVQRALKSFPDDLPFAYKEDAHDPSLKENLRDQAKIWAGLGDPSNYKAECLHGKESTFSVRYEAGEPMPKYAQASLEHGENTWPADFNVLHWAMKGLETGEFDSHINADEKLAYIKRRGPDILMDKVAKAGSEAGTAQSALAACAALASRNFITNKDWAWEILARVEDMKDPAAESHYPKKSRNAVRYHPKKFLIMALHSDLKGETSRSDSAVRILKLAADENIEISQSALVSIGNLHPSNSSLVMAGASMATSLFSLHIGGRGDDGRRDTSRQETHRKAVLETALSALENSPTLSLAPPPPAWDFGIPPRRRDWKPKPTEPQWWYPDIAFNHALASTVLPHYPIEAWLQDKNIREPVAKYILQLVTWTKKRAFPDWQNDHNPSTTELYEWFGALAHLCVRATPSLSSRDVIEQFLSPIIERENKDALHFASDVASAAACRLVMDASHVNDDAIAVLSACLDRLLQEDCFRRDSYHAGEIHDSHMLRMIQNLLFVSVQDASASNRFANGDWSDLGSVMPIIDLLMKNAGWAALVMETYLTLCEKAGTELSIADFTRHLLPHLNDGFSRLETWRGTLIPARIADVIQALAEANNPLNDDDARHLLAILDHLVDMGDRRAAALQQSALFRDVQLRLDG